MIYYYYYEMSHILKGTFIGVAIGGILSYGIARFLGSKFREERNGIGSLCEGDLVVLLGIILGGLIGTMHSLDLDFCRQRHLLITTITNSLSKSTNEKNN
jgi:hypothetical protein